MYCVRCLKHSGIGVVPGGALYWLHSFRYPEYRRQPDVIGARQFFECRPFGAAKAGFLLLCVSEFRGCPKRCPRPSPGFARPSSGCGSDRALHLSACRGQRSSAARCWSVSVHGSASDRKLTPRVHDLFDDGKQIEDRARQRSIRVTITTSPGVKAFRSFSSSRRSVRAPLTFS